MFARSWDHFGREWFFQDFQVQVQVRRAIGCKRTVCINFISIAVPSHERLEFDSTRYPWNASNTTSKVVACQDTAAGLQTLLMDGLKAWFSCLVILGPDFAGGNNVEVARAWEGQARCFSCPFLWGLQMKFIPMLLVLAFRFFEETKISEKAGLCFRFLARFWCWCCLAAESGNLCSYCLIGKEDTRPMRMLFLFSFVTSVLWLPSFVGDVGEFALIFRPHKYFYYSSCWKLSFPVPGNSSERLIALSRVARLLHSKNFALLWFHLQSIPAQGSRYNDKGCIHFMDAVDIVSGHPF